MSRRVLATFGTRAADLPCSCQPVKHVQATCRLQLRHLIVCCARLRSVILWKFNCQTKACFHYVTSTIGKHTQPVSLLQHWLCLRAQLSYLSIRVYAVTHDTLIQWMKWNSSVLLPVSLTNMNDVIDIYRHSRITKLIRPINIIKNHHRTQ